MAESTGMTSDDWVEEAKELLLEQIEAAEEGDLTLWETYVAIQCAVQERAAGQVPGGAMVVEAGFVVIRLWMRWYRFLLGLVSKDEMQRRDQFPVGCKEMRQATEAGYPLNKRWKSNPWPPDSDGPVFDLSDVGPVDWEAPPPALDPVAPPAATPVTAGLALWALAKLL